MATHFDLVQMLKTQSRHVVGRMLPEMTKIFGPRRLEFFYDSMRREGAKAAVLIQRSERDPALFELMSEHGGGDQREKLLTGLESLTGLRRGVTVVSQWKKRGISDEVADALICAAESSGISVVALRGAHNQGHETATAAEVDYIRSAFWQRSPKNCIDIALWRCTAEAICNAEFQGLLNPMGFRNGLPLATQCKAQVSINEIAKVAEELIASVYASNDLSAIRQIENYADLLAVVYEWSSPVYVWLALQAYIDGD